GIRSGSQPSQVLQREVQRTGGRERIITGSSLSWPAPRIKNT
ncbi:unnamed protein product, partial [Gulo gulo]